MTFVLLPKCVSPLVHSTHKGLLVLVQGISVVSVEGVKVGDKDLLHPLNHLLLAIHGGETDVVLKLLHREGVFNPLLHEVGVRVAGSKDYNRK